MHPKHKQRRHAQKSPAPHKSAAGQNRAPREGVLLWGQHAVAAAWLNPKRRCLNLWATENAQAAFDKTLAEAKRRGLSRPPAKRMERHELDRLTPPGSVHQGIVLEVMPLQELALHDIIDADNPPDLVIVIDGAGC